MEWEPERGIRCTACFDMRFERTALYAHENGFSLISSSLGISRWKNMDQINDCGLRAASHYDGVDYWTYNWRKEGGAARMYEIAKREEFYKQEYCGCIFSLRDSNDWRVKNGREEIKIGEEFYGEVEIDKKLTVTKEPACSLDVLDKDRGKAGHDSCQLASLPMDKGQKK
jgi:hypothetical protein